MAGSDLAARRGFVFLFLRAAARAGRRALFLRLTTARSPHAPLHRNQASSG
jgi:hypothetical protein